MVHVEVYQSDKSDPVFVCEVSERFPLSEILKLTIKSCRGTSPDATLKPDAGEATITTQSRDTVGHWFKRQPKARGQKTKVLKLRLADWDA